MRKYLLLTILFLGLAHSDLFAQDIHFSQFYAAPQLSNPAYTGNFNGNYRAGLHARRQWASVTVPYETIGGFADVGLMQGSMNGNWIGAGLAAYTDRAGDSGLSYTKIMASVAFHKAYNSDFYMSYGVSVGYVNRKVDFGSLYFDAQWDETVFDPSLPTNENYIGNTTNYLTLNAGISGNYELSEYSSIYFGGAIYHANGPEETFYSNINVPVRNKVGLKPVFNIGASIYTGVLTIEPAAYFSTQKKARELIVGSNVAFQISGDQQEGARFYLGAWFRPMDAIIPLIGFDYNRFRLLASYDINISELNSASNSQGGLELSLVHVGGIRPRASKLNCPRF